MNTVVVYGWVFSYIAYCMRQVSDRYQPVLEYSYMILDVTCLVLAIELTELQTYDVV